MLKRWSRLIMDLSNKLITLYIGSLCTRRYKVGAKTTVARFGTQKRSIKAVYGFVIRSIKANIYVKLQISAMNS